MNYLLAFICALQATGVFAAVIEHDPLNRPLRDWGFVLGMALLGGFASWYKKVKRGELAASSLFSLVGEFAVAALAGLVCYFICDWLNLPLGVTGAFTGLAGHAGAKGITVAEILLQRSIEKRFNITAADMNRDSKLPPDEPPLDPPKP